MNVEELSLFMGVEPHFPIASCFHVKGSLSPALFPKSASQVGDLFDWWRGRSLSSSLILGGSAPPLRALPLWSTCSLTALAPVSRLDVLSATRGSPGQTVPAQEQSGSQPCFLTGPDPHSPPSLYQWPAQYTDYTQSHLWLCVHLSTHFECGLCGGYLSNPLKSQKIKMIFLNNLAIFLTK